MNKFVYLLLFMAVLSAITDSSDVPNFARESGKFSMNLYKNVAEGDTGSNLVLSPISIQTGLGLAYLGADGLTASEMSEGLHLDRNTEVAGTQFKELIDFHADSGIVKIANKIYVNSGFDVKPEFNQLASTNFYSTAEKLDMSDGASAAHTINNWVKGQTNNKINKVVEPRDVQGTKAVLVNTVHFKAKWRKPFKVADTKKSEFWISQTESEEVDMMSTKSHLQYGMFNDYSVINLPYKDSNFSLLVVLPTERTGLSQVEEAIENFSVLDLMNTLGRTMVTIKLPKFSTEFSVELRPVLEKMGMGTMFTTSADFSKLSSGNMVISKVIHKTIFNIDEYGTEAASATAVSMILPLTPYSKFFIANHPFLYLLVDTNGHVFFMGRYIKP